MSFDAQAGVRLSEERNRLGYSQQALADVTGLARVMLSRYERAVAEPGASALMALAEAGVDLSFVLMGQETVTSGTLSPDESRLVSCYRKTGLAQRGALMEVAGALAQVTSSAGGTAIHIGGDVGQSIAGDATFNAPVTAVRKEKKR